MAKLIFTVLALILLATPAWACRCRYPEHLSEYRDRADYVLLGKVIRVSDKQPIIEGETFYYKKVTLRVETWWKGGDEKVKEFEVEDQISTCSLEFRVGQRWLVYARGSRHQSNQCDGSLKIADAAAHLKYLGSGVRLR